VSDQIILLHSALGCTTIHRPNKQHDVQTSTEALWLQKPAAFDQCDHRAIPLLTCILLLPLLPGPWPAKVSQSLPAGYVPLAEACWARQTAQRPSARQVLQRLLAMLAQADGHGAQQA
jgi:hypothetical protein